MKRTMIWLLGVVATLFTSLAFANATAVTITGSVSAQTGVGAARVVRQGDTLRAGDTVATSAGSSAVLRFEDGQIAALGPNSRMVITTYEYNAQSKSGNILLSLISGGMKAITGLIGKSNPQRVAYRAGNYTIGIRGTTANIATDGGNVVVTVDNGSITFSVGGQTYTVTADNGAFIGANGAVRTDTITAIVQYVQNNQQTLNQSLQGATSVPINVPTTGATGTSGTGDSVSGTISTGTTPGTGGQAGTGGGGGSGSGS